jgi:hypothetical protein
LEEGEGDINQLAQNARKVFYTDIFTAKEKLGTLLDQFKINSKILHKKNDDKQYLIVCQEYIGDFNFWKYAGTYLSLLPYQENISPSTIWTFDSGISAETRRCVSQRMNTVLRIGISGRVWLLICARQSPPGIYPYQRKHSQSQNPEHMIYRSPLGSYHVRFSPDEVSAGAIFDV